MSSICGCDGLNGRSTSAVQHSPLYSNAVTCDITVILLLILKKSFILSSQHFLKTHVVYESIDDVGVIDGVIDIVGVIDGVVVLLGVLVTDGVGLAPGVCVILGVLVTEGVIDGVGVGVSDGHCTYPLSI